MFMCPTIHVSKSITPTCKTKEDERHSYSMVKLCPKMTFTVIVIARTSTDTSPKHDESVCTATAIVDPEVKRDYSITHYQSN